MALSLQQQDLDFERNRFKAETNAGISLPAAGALYWIALGLAGFVIHDKYIWSLIAAFTSGLIFPLGIALQKPLKAKVLNSSSVLKGVMLRGVIGVNLLIPLYVALIMDRAVDYVPLAMALGMTVHWPLASWVYASRAAMFHAISRVAVVTAIWFSMPEWRFTVLPLSVAAIYFITTIWMGFEARAARKLISK